MELVHLITEYSISCRLGATFLQLNFHCG